MAEQDANELVAKADKKLKVRFMEFAEIWKDPSTAPLQNTLSTATLAAPRRWHVGAFAAHDGRLRAA